MAEKVVVGERAFYPESEFTSHASVRRFFHKRVMNPLPGVLDCPLPETTTTVPSTTSLPASCGNDVVEPGEDCEPPLSFCRGGCNPFTMLCVDYQCSSECSCPAPLCGDWLIDPGDEECDPPGSECDGGTCNASCGCD